MFKNSVLILSFFVFIFGFSQTNLNAYKYVIVPNQYDFLKKVDQFQLNSISEFLFNKYGFVALKEDSEYPDDLKNNRCLALRSNVLSDGKLFKTRLTIVLKDCNNKLAYTSKIGESRDKEYKVAYNKALRAAFKSVSLLNHKYEPKNSSNTLNKSSEIKTNEDTPLINKANPLVEEVKINSKAPSISSSNVLYAQAIDNGFQLVDSTPKVIYRLLKTNVNNVFLVEGKEAVIYKSNSSWVLEFYENGNLKQVFLKIKF